jgi:hypothetical protein
MNETRTQVLYLDEARRIARRLELRRREHEPARTAAGDGTSVARIIELYGQQPATSAACAEPAKQELEPSSAGRPGGAREQAILALRIGVALEFLGHGIVAMSGHEGRVPLFAPFGIERAGALLILPVVGVLDVFLAGLTLLRPVRIAVLWMVAWSFFSACLGPLAGMPLLEFVERGANWAAPLALLLLLGLPRRLRDWWC